MTGSATAPGFISDQFHQQGPLRFIQCILNGQLPEVGVNDGRGALEMILAAYQAARTGITQTIDGDSA